MNVGFKQSNCSQRKAFHLSPIPTMATPSLRRPVLSLPAAASRALARRPPRRRISAYGYEQAKALTFADYGDPAAILSLHAHSIAPAHGALLTLRFLAAPINPADINQLQGVYPSKPTFTTDMGTAAPLAVGGNEGVAEVIAVGADAAKAGWQKGDWAIMRAPGFGTWRTHAQTTADRLLKLEPEWLRGGGEDVTPVQAGTVSVNPCTAYRMLRGFAALREGEWFVQNGANSGVGRAAVQLGRIWGYRSINVVRARETAEQTDALRRELQELGATVVVTEDEAQGKGFADRVKEATGGGRDNVRLALNCVGGKSATALAKVLSPEGAHVTYGAMARQPVQLPFALMVFKNIRFEGFWVSRWSEQNPDDKARAVAEVLAWTREGKFRDAPTDPVKWTWDTKQDELVKAVDGTLGGYRKGKGVFVFEGT
ncbi:MAG: 2-enoyl thioester reductase domain-containing protein [Terriglobus roseus]|nr:2-enoyl thioester reductase domain-containing protein [Terriglobus roseus]